MLIFGTCQIWQHVGLKLTYEVGCQIAGHHAQIVKPKDDFLLEEVKGWYECQHEKVNKCHVEEEQVGGLKS